MTVDPAKIRAALGLRRGASDADVREALAGLYPAPTRQSVSDIRPGSVLASTTRVTVPGDAPQPGSTAKAWAQWGVQSGRFPAWRARHWESVVAANGADGIATLVALSPVLATAPPEPPAGTSHDPHGGDTPLLTQLDRQVFGEWDPDELRREQDLEAERELRAAIEDDRELEAQQQREAEAFEQQQRQQAEAQAAVEQQIQATDQLRHRTRRRS